MTESAATAVVGSDPHVLDSFPVTVAVGYISPG